MATFLEICQGVARDSGTVSGGKKPTTVINQSGRLAKIVYWTMEAWKRIQTDRKDWLFRRKEFEFSLIASTARYTAASRNINDLDSWITGEHGLVTIYNPDIGVADEGPLYFISYQDWVKRFNRGQQYTNKPAYWSVSPSKEFLVGPVPDKAYTVRGEHVIKPQILAADNDVPIIDDHYHDVIKWRALVLLNEHDEAAFTLGAAINNYNDIKSDMIRDLLPEITIGAAPIA